MMRMEHLTPDRINALKNGILSETEAALTLEHIGECERCAAAFAECYSDEELLELPAGFKRSVFSAIEQEKRTSVSVHSNNHNKRELFRYSFRVSVAACITLFLLFSGTIDYGINFSRSIHTDLTGFHVITENLKGISDKLVDFEVTKYLKEEL